MKHLFLKGKIHVPKNVRYTFKLKVKLNKKGVKNREVLPSTFVLFKKYRVTWEKFKF